ncbi:MAG: Brp/Blh family beta-carotene 15,15'-dioxygenase [Pseudomonadota bacterium]
MIAALRRQHGPFFAMIAAAIGLGSASGAISDPQDQLVIAGIAVALLGVPHGALDPLIARQNGHWKDAWGLARYLLTYSALVGAAVALWLAMPALSLGLFLAISAWHFGGDWAGSGAPWQRCALGAAVLTLPCVTHAAAVAADFALLIPLRDAFEITAWLTLVSPVLFGFTLLFAFGLRIDAPDKSAELLALVALALTLEPIMYFVVYFCGLHSPRHLLEAILRLESVASSTTVVTGIGISAITVAIALTIVLAAAPTNVDTALLQVVFIGLFALTIPHMLLGALPAASCLRPAR